MIGSWGGQIDPAPAWSAPRLGGGDTSLRPVAARSVAARSVAARSSAARPVEVRPSIPRPADTVFLSVDEAVERALQANPSLRAQEAKAEAGSQLPLQATPAFLPSVSLGLQAMRTTDPVAVFGLKLRQENFMAEDLALDALNRPDAYSGYNASATIQLPLLAPEGLYGFAAARKAAEAQEAGAERAAGATRFFALQAYVNAALAARRVAALDTALTAARSHVTQAEAMRDQGLVTGLDARLADVKASGVEVQRLIAQADARNALSALKALLALPDSAPLALSESLESIEVRSPCAEGEEGEGSPHPCSLELRGDLRARSAGADAAAAEVKKAWASQLPALAAFGSLGHYARTSPLGKGGGDWTVGLGVTWNPFQGLAGVGAVRAAKAERRAALAQEEEAFRQAELQVLQARRMLEAAQERARVTARAAGEARATLEQARVRYRTGTSPITELLDVQAAATAAALSELAARGDLLLAHAALDLAYGVYDR